MGCRIAAISAKQETVRMVSAMLSPLETEELLASEKPMVDPPIFSMAVSVLSLVRVEGS